MFDNIDFLMNITYKKIIKKINKHKFIIDKSDSLISLIYDKNGLNLTMKNEKNELNNKCIILSLPINKP